MTFDITWLQRGGPPQHPPNPAYSHGIELDMSKGAVKSCQVELPYPTKPLLGLLIVTCKTCGLKVSLTTAGRPDDPRAVRVACKIGDA
jgi:hypothetical protein